VFLWLEASLSHILDCQYYFSSILNVALIGIVNKDLYRYNSSTLHVGLTLMGLCGGGVVDPLVFLIPLFVVFLWLSVYSTKHDHKENHTHTHI
jgi:hypothetical protein